MRGGVKERVRNEKGGFAWGEKEMKNKQRSKQRRMKREKNQRIKMHEKQRIALQTSGRLGNVLER